jgi:phosphoglycolate phosphatase-like HAD superfamily hydrolase
MKALVLDFDGVIANSAPEAFRVALRTYTELCPESGLASREPGALYAAFVDLMPLGNRAEDFGVALRALDSGVRVADQADYDVFYAAQADAWRRDFHRRFYEVRAELSRSDPAGWRALLPPYPRLVETLRRRAGDAAYAIATAKDRASVGALLEDYGVRDLFRPDLVLDKETGVHKTAHLEHLRAVLALPFEELTFVDDKVNHLDAVSRLGVRCALAAWGYNGPREHALARAHGHLVCRLEDVDALFSASRGGGSRSRIDRPAGSAPEEGS